MVNYSNAIKLIIFVTPKKTKKLIFIYAKNKNSIPKLPHALLKLVSLEARQLFVLFDFDTIVCSSHLH